MPTVPHGVPLSGMDWQPSQFWWSCHIEPGTVSIFEAEFTGQYNLTFMIMFIGTCLFLWNNPDCNFLKCIFFFKNNVSVSKVLESLEGLRKVKFPPKNTILHAYLHFEALTNHNYSYSCVCCGYHPPVVVMDLHKNGVFNLPGKSQSCACMHVCMCLCMYYRQ